MKRPSRWKYLAISLPLVESVFICCFSASVLAAQSDIDYTPIPATVGGIWNLIDEKDKRLRDIINTGHIEYVHHLCFSIRDLVAALASHSKIQDAQHSRQLRNDAAKVAELAVTMDAASDANDTAGLKKQLEEMDTLLRAIRTIDPSVQGDSRHDGFSPGQSIEAGYRATQSPHLMRRL